MAFPEEPVERPDGSKPGLQCQCQCQRQDGPAIQCRIGHVCGHLLPPIVVDEGCEVAVSQTCKDQPTQHVFRQSQGRGRAS